MLVNEVMTPNPTSAPVSATVGDVLQILESMNVRHLPIVDADGELVGMLSDRDLRNASIPLFSGGELVRRRPVLNAPVATLMSSDVISVHEEASVVEAVELMLANQIGAVPVVDPDGNLVGIVSYVDVLREVQDKL